MTGAGEWTNHKLHAISPGEKDGHVAGGAGCYDLGPLLSSDRFSVAGGSGQQCGSGLQHLTGQSQCLILERGVILRNRYLM